MGVMSNATFSFYGEDMTVDQAGFTATSRQFAVTSHVPKHFVMAKFAEDIAILDISSSRCKLILTASHCSGNCFNISLKP